jgi:hypothetical protein
MKFTHSSLSRPTGHVTCGQLQTLAAERDTPVSDAKALLYSVSCSARVCCRFEYTEFNDRHCKFILAVSLTAF